MRGVAGCWGASRGLPHGGAPLLLAQHFGVELQLGALLGFVSEAI